jgi:DNA modification methylase
MSNRYLPLFISQVRLELSHVTKIEKAAVERDIAARRHEANIGKLFAYQRERIQREIAKLGVTENQWLKRELGTSLATMLRYRHLYRDWKRYVVARRAAGPTGQSGLEYALSLIPRNQPRQSTGLPTNLRHSRLLSRVHSEKVPESAPAQFITGDALSELRKMPDQSIDVIVTSPPYWPLKRAYSGAGIGYEATATDYIESLVAVFHEAQRVLRDSGVAWVVIGDSYSSRGRINTADPKARPPEIGLREQRGDRPAGNLLGLPWRLAFRLQDDGWVLRSEIVWDKEFATPESVTNRVTRVHENIFMLTRKTTNYHYNQDATRVPTKRPYSKLGKRKDGVLRRDLNRDFRLLNNPMGRNGTSVWRCTPRRHDGDHSATMPLELAQWMLAASCDDNAVVCDPFGGAGTTALAAVRLGFRAISIDLDPKATAEAIERLRHG